MTLFSRVFLDITLVVLKSIGAFNLWEYLSAANFSGFLFSSLMVLTDIFSRVVVQFYKIWCWMKECIFSTLAVTWSCFQVPIDVAYGFGVAAGYDGTPENTTLTETEWRKKVTGLITCHSLIILSPPPFPISPMGPTPSKQVMTPNPVSWKDRKSVG